MVSGKLEVMSACSEFTQNAWKKELCINCQRSRVEHASVVNGSGSSQNVKPPVPSKNSPVLVKRNSKILKSSIIVHDSHENGKGDKEYSPERIQENDDNNVKNDSLTNVSKKGEKGVKVGFVESTPEIIGYDGGIDNVPLEDDVKSSTKKLLKVGFVDTDPEIIGYDGGFDNISVFADDPEDGSDSEGSAEELSFTEEEREFVLLALENTLWNSDQDNLNGKSSTDRSKVKATSKEFEDIEILSILKTNRFTKVSDCDALFHRHCGTFPLRSKSAGSKTPVGGSLFDGRLKKTSSDIELERIDQDNSFSDYKSTILHSSALSYSQPSSSSSASLSSDTDTKRSSLDRKKDTSVSITNTAMPYKVVNVKDIIDDDKVEMKPPDLPKKSSDKHSSDIDDADSLEGFNPQIDLESSSAGMALVDLLNDVLARYSDGETFKSIEDHELLPEVVNAVSEEIEKSEEASELSQGDAKALKGNLKSKQFEKKIASLAASLDLSKQKGKKQAPRPPTSPPPPEPVSPTKKTSPVHSMEPNFKMVPIGKPIIDHTVTPSQRKTSSSDLAEDGMEGSKMRVDNKAKKGITSFFRNILRRGRDSTDGSGDAIAAGESSSSLSSSEGSGNQSDKKSAEIETSNKEKIPNKSSSPQMKTKVLPPISGNSRARTSVMVAFAEKPKSEKLSDSNLSEKAEGSENSSPKTKKQEVNMEKGNDGNKTEDKNVSDKGSTTVSGSPVQTSSGGVVKPPIAARPKPVPSSQKPSISPQASQKDTGSKSSPIRERKASTGSESETKTESPKRNDGDNVIVRRRAKSPKRSAAPTRPSVPTKGIENRHSVFTKELEMRLSKNVDHMKVSPPPAPVAPPSSAKSAKTDQKKLTAPQPPASPTSPKETNSPSVVMETKDDNTSDQVSAEKEKVVEKIELPTTHSSRRSFLGKLGKGKSKAAPRPPQNVKRTKSITENTLQGGDLQVKKIDASDISGPVVSLF